MDRFSALKAFTRVVEAGSFTRAADSLNMPNATLSKTIQQLEAHLGVSLLQRTTRRITVTPEGREYYEKARRLLEDLEELAPRCEIYSIDEAFCDVSGVRHCKDLTDFGREIRATVQQRTHLTLGVGIAPTKTLAKLANHAAKQWQRQTGGVVDLSCPQRHSLDTVH